MLVGRRSSSSSSSSSSKKVQLAHYMPAQALWSQEVWVSEFLDKIVSRKRRSPLPLRRYRWYSFLLEVESTPRP